ncbi:MAG: hypothetical protein U0176_10080 [Bacteroidia bacterium]
MPRAGSRYNGASAKTPKASKSALFGTYAVTVTDANGCTATASHTITFGPSPTVNMPPVDTVCIGSMATLDAGAGFASYQWSTGANTQTIKLAARSTGAQANANGCSATGSTYLVKGATYPVELGAPNVTICDRGQVTLNAGPWFTNYQWSTGGGWQWIDVTQPGTYSVTVTDAWGCVSNDAVTVTAAGLVPFDFLPATAQVCAGSTYLIDAGNAWADYQWGTGEVDQYYLTSTGGTFQVTVSTTMAAASATPSSDPGDTSNPGTGPEHQPLPR